MYSCMYQKETAVLGCSNSNVEEGTEEEDRKGLHMKRLLIVIHFMLVTPWLELHLLLELF